MRAIFISYRRHDAEGQAGRLFDDLARHFGKDAVFMDVATIEAGRDFRRAIDEHVTSCGVLLAMIGKDWLTATDEAGARRLDDPMDFVRLETASALQRDIPVIPVLVQGARMPRVDDLPDNLKDLAFRNAVELTHARWDSDLQLLVSALQSLVQSKPEPLQFSPALQAGTRRTMSRFGVAGIAVLVLALGGYTYYQNRATSASDVQQPQRVETASVATGKQPGNPRGPDLVPPKAKANVSQKSAAADTAPRDVPGAIPPEVGGPRSGTSGSELSVRAEVEPTEELRIPDFCKKNNSRQCAAGLNPGTSDSDVFAGASDSRFYFVNVTKAGVLTFRLDPMPNSRGVTITIQDENDAKLETKLFRRGSPGTMAVKIRKPGKYVAVLDPVSCCSGAPYNYTFALIP